MVTREVGRLEAKSEKAELVPRWHGHQERCRALVSTILLFFNFAAKLCSNEDFGRCPVCKTFKSATAQVESRGGWGVGRGGTQASQSNRGLLRGGQFEKTSRVAKTEALESDRPKICISACVTSWLCELQGFTSPESQSHQLKMGQ